MSAMPERVLAYVSVFGTYSQTKDEYHDVECILVPESRLLAAEARVREVRVAAEAAEAETQRWADATFTAIENGTAHVIYCNGDHRIPLWDVKPGVLCNCPIGQHFKELHRDLATLRAERDALVPLARFALNVLDVIRSEDDSSYSMDGIEAAAIKWIGSPYHDTAIITQARAILSRRTNDG